MNQLNDNEKAAIAAGLWEPGRVRIVTNDRNFHEKGYLHHEVCGVLAPDMHDLTNLWRALENRNVDVIPGFTINGGEGTWSVQMYLGHSVQLEDGKLGARLIEIERPLLVNALFAALVALYNAEHPKEI